MDSPYLRVGYFGGIIKNGLIPLNQSVFLDWDTKEVYYRIADVEELASPITPSSFIFIDTINLIAYKVSKTIKPIKYDFTFQDLLSLEIYDWNDNQLSIKLPIFPGTNARVTINSDGSNVVPGVTQYRVANDVTIESGQTLNFPPGSDVLFLSDSATDHPMLIINQGASIVSQNSTTSIGTVTFRSNIFYPHRSGGIVIKGDAAINMELRFMGVRTATTSIPALTLDNVNIDFNSLRIIGSHSTSLYLESSNITFHNLYIYRSYVTDHPLIYMNNSTINMVMLMGQFPEFSLFNIYSEIFELYNSTFYSVGIYDMRGFGLIYNFREDQVVTINNAGNIQTYNYDQRNSIPPPSGGGSTASVYSVSSN